MTRLIKGEVMERVVRAAGFERQSDGRWIQKVDDGYNELMVDYDPQSHDYDFVVVIRDENGEFVEATTLYAFLRVLG